MALLRDTCVSVKEAELRKNVHLGIIQLIGHNFNNHEYFDIPVYLSILQMRKLTLTPRYSHDIYCVSCYNC